VLTLTGFRNPVRIVSKHNITFGYKKSGMLPFEIAYHQIMIIPCFLQSEKADLPGDAVPFR